MRLLLSLLSATAISVLAGCGGGGGGTGGEGSGKTCGTLAAPDIVTVEDVQPAAGSMVANQSIVHAFTVVNAPGLFQSLSLGLPAGKHTAGDPDPAMWSFAVTQMGADVRYEAGPVQWATAPGEVYVQVPSRFQLQSGCVVALPDPLFTYSVVPGTGGADGGTGGTDGGTGGTDVGTGGAGGGM